MNDPTLPGHPHAPASNETGWWDDNGQPAPWPDDFLDPEAGWSNGNTTATADDGDENDPENRPF